MSEHKEQIKQFLNLLANDKYNDANELFPKVVNSVLKNVINNNKPSVLTKLNAEAEQTAMSVLELEKTYTDTKDLIKNETT